MDEAFFLMDGATHWEAISTPNNQLIRIMVDYHEIWHQEHD
jgi:hypothetical protein